MRMIALIVDAKRFIASYKRAEALPAHVSYWPKLGNICPKRGIICCTPMSLLLTLNCRAGR